MDIMSQKEGVECVVKLIKEKKLIPVFGAGFSMNSPTTSDLVPDGNKATELMKQILLENCNELKETDLLDCDFNETAKLFYRLPNEVKKEFFKNYFTNVDLPEIQKKFLEFEWSYAYTLNVDDGIENTNLFKPVLPYRDLDRPDTTIKLLYKLHGDAITEVVYKESENIVFSSDQYLQAITDKRNKDFLINLIGDFSFSNMIFIGCSLKYEPDLKYVYEKSDHSATTMKITLCQKEPSFKEKSNLMDYGINTIILVEDYNNFYLEIIQNIKKSEAEANYINYRYKNPNFIKKDDKEKTYELLSGESIFDEKNNTFMFGGMHIIRNCLSEIETALSEENCVLLKGRRFSGKTYIIANLFERQRKYTQYFFPSSSNADEQVIFKLLSKENNSLFIFDSNSLSTAAYKLIANSISYLKNNNNKIVVALNSNDNYIAESLKGTIVEIPNNFFGKELEDNKQCADKYGLIKRHYKNTNIDYLQKIEERQRIQIFSTNKYFTKYTFNEQVLLLLLADFDKVYMDYALALDITIEEIEVLKSKLPLLVEEIKVEPTEKTVHCETKLVHNSKVMLIRILNTLTYEEIIKCIKYIVETFKDDKQRYRISVDVILFDTLNQIFGGRTGAGQLIYKVYEGLEDILNDSYHYWLQRAKCIYHIYPHVIEKLKKAYSYAKKVYFDGGYSIKYKAALTASLVSCLIYKMEKDTTDKAYYLGEAIFLGYEAVNSDYYRYNESYLNNELNTKKQRLSSYELLVEACTIYEETQVAGEYYENSKKLSAKIKKLKEQYRK